MMLHLHQIGPFISYVIVYILSALEQVLLSVRFAVRFGGLGLVVFRLVFFLSDEDRLFRLLVENHLRVADGARGTLFGAAGVG